LVIEALAPPAKRTRAIGAVRAPRKGGGHCTFYGERLVKLAGVSYLRFILVMAGCVFGEGRLDDSRYL